MRIVLRDALKNAVIAISVGAGIFFFGAFPQSGGWGEQGTDPLVLVLPLAGITLVIFSVLMVRDWKAHAWQRRYRRKQRT